MLAQDNPAGKWPSAGPKAPLLTLPPRGHVSALPSDPAPCPALAPVLTPAPPSPDPWHLVLMVPVSPQVVGAWFRPDHHGHPGGTDLSLHGGLPQQYLDKNPDGFRDLGGTGVSCPWVFILDPEFTCRNPSPQHGYAFWMVTLRKE